MPGVIWFPRWFSILSLVFFWSHLEKIRSHTHTFVEKRRPIPTHGHGVYTMLAGRCVNARREKPTNKSREVVKRSSPRTKKHAMHFANVSHMSGLGSVYILSEIPS
jgi:hypothetical protein